MLNYAAAGLTIDLILCALRNNTLWVLMIYFFFILFPYTLCGTKMNLFYGKGFANSQTFCCWRSLWYMESVICVARIFWLYVSLYLIIYLRAWNWYLYFGSMTCLNQVDHLCDFLYSRCRTWLFILLPFPSIFLPFGLSYFSCCFHFKLSNDQFLGSG